MMVTVKKCVTVEKLLIPNGSAANGYQLLAKKFLAEKLKSKRHKKRKF